MAARRTAGRRRGDAAVLYEKIEDEETRWRLGRSGGGGGRRALPFIGQGTFSPGLRHGPGLNVFHQIMAPVQAP